MSIVERPTPVAPAPPPTLSRRRRGDGALVLIGCMALALLLRAPYFGVALGIDEGGVAWVARQWSSGHGSLYGGQWLDRPPLLVALYRVAVTGGAPGIRGLGAAAALALVAGCFACGRLVGGERTGRIAALLAALLSGSVAISAVYAPGELLAAVPAVLSVAALAAAQRTGRLRHLVVAGALAVAALAIKQSFFDAGLAGAVYLVARTAAGEPRRLRAWLAYAAGAALPLLAIAAWLWAAHLRVSALLDALLGFRLQALHTLQGSNLSLLTRMHSLLLPAVGSLLVLAVPLAAAGAWRLRRERVLAVTLAAWLVGALAGVLGGGSYWPHYLIGLVPVAAVGSAVVLARLPRRPVAVVLVALVALAGAASVTGGAFVAAHPRRQTDAAVASYVRGRARAGDSFYALYARADLNDAVGLRTPFPYSWSLMMRARPDARPRLLALLDSSRRPTWVVRWQRTTHWHLDGDGAIAAALRRHYRHVATFGGRGVLLERGVRR